MSWKIFTPNLPPTLLHSTPYPPKMEVRSLHFTSHPTLIRWGQHVSTSLIERDGREYIRVLGHHRGSAEEKSMKVERQWIYCWNLRMASTPVVCYEPLPV